MSCYSSLVTWTSADSETVRQQSQKRTQNFHSHSWFAHPVARRGFIAGLGLRLRTSSYCKAEKVQTQQNSRSVLEFGNAGRKSFSFLLRFIWHEVNMRQNEISEYFYRFFSLWAVKGFFFFFFPPAGTNDLTCLCWRWKVNHEWEHEAALYQQCAFVSTGLSSKPLKRRPLFLDVVMPSGLCASIMVHLWLTVTGYNNGHTVKGNSLCPLVSPC